MDVGALVLLLAYLAGSIPTGLWLARLAGIDVRKRGSGNIGATNVGRTAGMRLGLLTLAIDVLKGALPVLVAVQLSTSAWLPACTGLAAFYGHIFSLFAGFHGGKGVATAAGAFLVLAPGVFGAAAAVFVFVVAVTRIVSLASLVAAVTLTVASIVTARSGPVSAAACVVAVTIAATHRENIRRLLRGTEPRFQAKT